MDGTFMPEAQVFLPQVSAGKDHPPSPLGLPLRLAHLHR